MKNQVKLNKSQIDLLKQGVTISKNGQSYSNNHYWFKPIDIDENGDPVFNKDGYTLCERLLRGEIPDIEAGYKKGGLKTRKYIIRKADDSPVDPFAWYFVLRVDKDPHARVAASAYAESVKKDNKLLSEELIKAIDSYENKAKAKK